MTKKSTDSNPDIGVVRVKYDSKNHISVLTQMYGSVWPKVLPFCLLNVVNISAVIYLDRALDIDISFNDKGHSFMSMIVSFLIVTRSSITYSRLMEARAGMTSVMRSCRELIQFAITFTRYDSSPGAQKWRSDMARKTISLLTCVVAVLQFESTAQNAWETPDLTERERFALQKAVGDDNERAPMILAMFLRSTIASHAEFLSKTRPPLHINKEMKLYGCVSEFVSAYHGLMKMMDTPFPFPLAQMNRTFLFMWVYTLPWALYNDDIKIPGLVLFVFFITYAFIGLEFVSIELDDPWGEDPNDFDVLALSKIVFEDIYISVLDADGEKHAKKLRGYFDEVQEYLVEDESDSESDNVHENKVHDAVISSNREESFSKKKKIKFKVKKSFNKVVPSKKNLKKVIPGMSTLKNVVPSVEGVQDLFSRTKGLFTYNTNNKKSTSSKLIPKALKKKTSKKDQKFKISSAAMPMGENPNGYSHSRTLTEAGDITSNLMMGAKKELKEKEKAYDTNYAAPPLYGAIGTDTNDKHPLENFPS
mmetsp:Transcript_16577/g.24865  ORF Transcript_16577/g.24865 Transcript_16577/m.24865 type:complete len:534 (+) Transcript_16577:222-1823(+)